MKIHKKASASSQRRPMGRPIRFFREKGFMLFCILMATALPALAALFCGGHKRAEDPAPWEERQVEMRRHEGERGEVLDYAQILSLS